MVASEPGADEAADPRSPRDRLLDAAREVVAEDGLEGLTLRAIARRAGVSHGAPLRHFPTLAALLAAVGADGFRRLEASVTAALAAAEASAAAEGRTLGALDRLGVAGDGYLAMALDQPGVFTVTFRTERVDTADGDYQAAGARSFDQLVGLVADAQAEGWNPGLPTRHLAAVVWAQVHGTAELHLHGALAAAIGPDQLPALRQVLHQILFRPVTPSQGGPA
jgi:AcrR family transcriptional regulator